jgi:membrane associated rhomboid family serine protease
MLVVPYSTDAPVYHWPFTTVALIALNILVFVAEVFAPEQAESLFLLFGHGIHPIQWVTCNFLHGGIFHLLFNMFFLWTFGLIVEGKLGWYKTLFIYLGIGILHAAIVQTLMLGTKGAACGASAAIFGFMAICLVWAPENCIQCLFLLIVFPIFFDVRVSVLVGLFLALQILSLISSNMAMSSELLHVIGAAIGFPIAIWMLKKGHVDCENWDVFSVWSGRHKMTDEEWEEAQQRKANAKFKGGEGQVPPNAALEQIRQILREEHPLLALKANQRMTREMPGWILPQPDLWNLIQALHRQKLWSESVLVMTEYLEHYSESAILVRLKLAQILAIEHHRPDQAMQELAKIEEEALDGRHREFLEKLRAKVKQLLGAPRPEIGR